MASRHLKTGVGLLVAAGMGVLPMAAKAQCALCYLSTASSGSKGIAAIKNGILILLVPTVVLFASVLWLALRRRNGPETGQRIELPPFVEEESFPSFPASEDRHSPSRA